MLKTFTLDKRSDQILSDTAGTVTFHVTDENNVSRKIFADTHLDKNQMPQGITATNKRELPLVEGLFRLKIGETTEFDFTLFNKTFNRKLDKTKNQIAHDVVTDMQNEKEPSRMKAFLKGFKSPKETA